MKKIITLLLLFFVAVSCASSDYLNFSKVEDTLSNGKSVVVFGFSQGDQVIHS